MARISGVDLPRDKRIEIGLTYVYGIGRATSNRLLKEAGVNPDTRVRDYRKLVATEESVTEKDFQFVVRRQRQTQELVRVLRRQ